MLKRARTVLLSISCCFFIVVSMNVMEAQEPSKSSVDSKRYNLSICAVFKNEAEYLKEWIEYHLLVGVDHFYLYNIGSTDRFKSVLNRYIHEGIVTLLDWPHRLEYQDEDNAFMWALGVKVPAYENAIKVTAGKETTWLVFVDIDEFLVPPNASNLTELLERYDEYPGVILSSDYFDSSKRDVVLPQRKLVIEAVELTKAPRQNPQMEVSKTIFKPDLCERFTWPPYKCVFKDNQEAVLVGKQELRINHYTNRNTGYFFAKAKEKLRVDNRMISDEETTELLGLGYEIEDQDRVIHRFVPELLKRMGYELGWGW